MEATASLPLPPRMDQRPQDPLLKDLLVKDLGRSDYLATWTRMRGHTSARTPDSPDELWLTEHDPVFTLGQASRPEHLLAPGDIPVLQSDRGGQVTYHGPGQIVLYVLFDLARRRCGVRSLVRLLEAAVIDLLACRGLEAEGRVDAPGVYVDGRKIASIGLRVRQGRTYHGIALNAAMELEPFRRINPCGYCGLEVIDLRGLGVQDPLDTLKHELARHVIRRWADTDPTRV